MKKGREIGEVKETQQQVRFALRRKKCEKEKESVESGKNTQSSPDIETPKIIGPGFRVFQDPGDQKSGEYEKKVDAQSTIARNRDEDTSHAG